MCCNFTYQQYKLFQSLVCFALNGNSNDFDFTYSHFTKDGCNHCGETDDTIDEKRRFEHVVKYCQSFGAGKAPFTLLSLPKIIPTMRMLGYRHCKDEHFLNSFKYYSYLRDTRNGMYYDKCYIYRKVDEQFKRVSYAVSGTGMGLIILCAGTELKLIDKAKAIQYVIETLSSLDDATLCPRSQNGFFAQFPPNDRQFSTIDTAILCLHQITFQIMNLLKQR